MSAFHVFPLAVALLLSTAAVAQEGPAPAPAPAAAAAAASMPHDCANATARRDHGADKGTSTPMSGDCPMAAAASPAKAKAKRGHDHSRFHKLM